MSIQIQVARLLSRIAAVSTPRSPGVDLVAKLALTPRSGKSLRIARAGLALPTRSVLDHILSLAVFADVLAGMGIAPPNRRALAYCIVFHDLAEALTGDTPEFTTLPEPLQKNARLAESRAHRTLARILPGDLSPAYNRTLALLRAPSRTRSYFEMIDKADPILAVWRYLDSVRSCLDAELFLEAMHDFFANPRPQQLCVCPEVVELLRYLQNPHNAAAYPIRGKPPDGGPLAVLFARLVSGRPQMLCVESQHPSARFRAARARARAFRRSSQGTG